MGIVKEFKDFAMRGNVVDLAVGVIIGGAFGKIVSSLVADVVLPLVGLLVGGVNFTDLKLTLKEGTALQIDEAGNIITPDLPPVTINYGNFIQVSVDFLIIAFVIFMFIKAINFAKKKQEQAPASAPAPSKQEVLLAEIRDLLKNKGM